MQETNNVLWDTLGPRLRVINRGGEASYRYCIRIEDINPDAEIIWCVSKTDLLKIGWWFIRRALFARQAKP